MLRGNGIIDALAWKHDLVKHDKLLVTVLACLVLNVLVRVVVHEADPLVDRVAEYLTANATVCRVVALVLKLFVVSC